MIWLLQLVDERSVLGMISLQGNWCKLYRYCTSFKTFMFYNSHKYSRDRILFRQWINKRGIFQLTSEISEVVDLENALIFFYCSLKLLASSSWCHLIPLHLNPQNCNTPIMLQSSETTQGQGLQIQHLMPAIIPSSLCNSLHFTKENNFISGRWV